MMCFVAKVAQIQTSNQGLLALGFFNNDNDAIYFSLVEVAPLVI
jgi:hypothetical protein